MFKIDSTSSDICGDGGISATNIVKDVLKAKLDKTLHANLFNSTILPATFYKNKTWATIKNEEQLLVMTQRVIKRSIPEILLHKHIQSKAIPDMLVECWKQKFHWARHVTGYTDNWWTLIIIKWYLRNRKWPLRRSPWFLEYEMSSNLGQVEEEGQDQE